MAKILVVEDDPKISGILTEWLTKEMHTVELANTGTLADELLEAFSYDVVVLDWNLPELSGIELLTRLRNRGAKTPVLMLTGRDQLFEKETGLDSGADDYLTKPFEVKELSARIRALLRRSPDLAGMVLKVGDLIVDPATCQVSKSGATIQLTTREFQLLEFLARHKNQFFTPEVLLERVWASDAEASPLTVRVCVKRIRDKIDTPGIESQIENVRGIGYRLVG
jgi:DNA-binding response OmpR family regulator